MKTKTKVASAAVGIAALAAVATTSVIYNDGGGSVYEYVKKYDDLYANNVRVRVEGACYSSCTMALGYPNVCLDPNAVLGFHPAYISYFFGLFHYSIHPQATEEMRRHYPPDALAIINKHDGLKDNGGWLRPEIRLIKASEFPAHYRCT
jgi:hypothetical protein